MISYWLTFSLLSLQALPPKCRFVLYILEVLTQAKLLNPKEPNLQKTKLNQQDHFLAFWERKYGYLITDPITLDIELLPCLLHHLPHPGRHYCSTTIRSNTVKQYFTKYCHLFTNKRVLLPCSSNVDFILIIISTLPNSNTFQHQHKMITNDKSLWMLTHLNTLPQDYIHRAIFNWIILGKLYRFPSLWVEPVTPQTKMTTHESLLYFCSPWWLPFHSILSPPYNPIQPPLPFTSTNFPSSSRYHPSCQAAQSNWVSSNLCHTHLTAWII